MTEIEMIEETEYVVMWQRSAGNAEVGSMWTETAVFPETARLSDVAAWLAEKKFSLGRAGILGDDGNVILQIAQKPWPADDGAVAGGE